MVELFGATGTAEAAESIIELLSQLKKMHKRLYFMKDILRHHQNKIFLSFLDSTLTDKKKRTS